MEMVLIDCLELELGTRPREGLTAGPDVGRVGKGMAELRCVNFVLATSEETAHCLAPSAWWSRLGFCEPTVLLLPSTDLC